jgi:hypothetical protein
VGVKARSKYAFYRRKIGLIPGEDVKGTGIRDQELGGCYFIFMIHH